ncbi:hypothetical protein ACFSTC_23020 [Nonomuraea ferruginea]
MTGRYASEPVILLAARRSLNASLKCPARYATMLSRLPYDTDPGREPARHLGVFVSLVGIVLFEGALGGEEVPTHQLGKIRGQGPQLLAHLLVEVVGADVGRDLRQRLALRPVTLAVVPAEAGASARPLLPRERTRAPPHGAGHGRHAGVRDRRDP